MVRAREIAPAIADIATVKFLSFSAAVFPGTKGMISSRCCFNSPAIRFLTVGFVRAISGASAAIGQPSSGVFAMLDG